MNPAAVRKDRTCRKCGEVLRGTAAELRAHTCAGTDTYRLYPVLATLPQLVRQQQIHAARVAAVAPDVKEDKRLRDDIDALLVQAGLQRGDKVTCVGYDVTHHERDGQEKMRAELLVPQLVLLELAPDVIETVVENSTETGPPSLFATVTASKGSQVRAREPLRMAKATRRA